MGMWLVSQRSLPYTLNEFLKLGEHLNFRTTAKDLGISHTSLTRHIADLEHELGVPLFERTTRNVQLTDYGIAYTKHARRILETQANAEQELAKIRNTKMHNLQVAIVPAFERYGFIESIYAFQQAHSTIHVAVQECDNPKPLLLEKACDFVIAPRGAITDDAV